MSILRSYCIGKGYDTYNRARYLGSARFLSPRMQLTILLISPLEKPRDLNTNIVLSAKTKYLITKEMLLLSLDPQSVIMFFDISKGLSIT